MCNTSRGYADWPEGNEMPMAQDKESVWSETIIPLPAEYCTCIFALAGMHVYPTGQ